MPRKRNLVAEQSVRNSARRKQFDELMRSLNAPPPQPAPTPRPATPTPEEDEGSWWDYAPAAVRTASTFGATPGGPWGSAIAGGGELLAQLLEGEFNPKRAALEMGLGFVPAAKYLSSAVKGAGMMGGGTALRELTGDGLDTSDLPSIGLSTGIGAGAGALGKMFLGPKNVKTPPPTPPPTKPQTPFSSRSGTAWAPGPIPPRTPTPPAGPNVITRDRTSEHMLAGPYMAQTFNVADDLAGKGMQVPGGLTDDALRAGQPAAAVDNVDQFITDDALAAAKAKDPNLPIAEPRSTLDDGVKVDIVEKQKTPQGWTFRKSRPANLLNDERGAVNTEAALAAMLGLSGAAIGGAMDSEGSPLDGMLAGGLAGAALPFVPSVVGGASKALGGAAGNAVGKAKQTLEDIGEYAPQYQRFSYLASGVGLPANAVVGPYGAMVHGALEDLLAGGTRGREVLKNADPRKFLQIMRSPETKAEAERLLKTKAPERIEESFKEIPGPLGKVIRYPGDMMTRGDVTGRGILQKGGFSEDEARAITMTHEPDTKWGKALAHGGAGSKLLALLAPFRRTPVNIVESGLDRMPVFGAARQMWKGVDPKLIGAQQAIGTTQGAIGLTAGSAIDNENRQASSAARRYLSNFAGRYSLPMAIGFAIGQARQDGDQGAVEFLSKVALETGNAMPLPTLQPVEDAVRFGQGSTREPYNPSIQTDDGRYRQIPTGLYPAIVRDVYPHMNDDGRRPRRSRRNRRERRERRERN